MASRARFRGRSVILAATPGLQEIAGRPSENCGADSVIGSIRKKDLLDRYPVTLVSG